MNKREARQLGLASGEETAIYGDFTPDELASEARFLEACCEIFENKRQYADSPTYDMANERNADSLFDAFDQGETDGACRYYRQHYGDKVKSNPLV